MNRCFCALLFPVTLLSVVAATAKEDQVAVSAPFTTEPTDGTWVELDFGTPARLSQLVMVARANKNDTIFTFNPSGANGAAL